MQQVAQYVISIAGFLAAIYGIYSFFARPVKWSKEKKGEIDKELQGMINTAIQNALTPIQHQLDELSYDVQEIREINVEQSEKLEWMNKATLDLLRQEIMYLYNHHYKEKKLTIDENTQLHKLYDDYVAGGGNSFVADLVGSMSKWEIVPNSDTEHK